MAFFFRHAKKQDKPQTRLQVLRCPAFSGLLQEYSDEQKYRILDIGEVSSANVTFFSGLRCKLFVGGVIPGLLSYQTLLQDDEQPVLPQRDLLDLDDLSDLNLVMCWDLLNYLDLRLVKSFSNCLHRMMARGASLHAFIYIHKTMPIEPGSYQILDADQMNVTHTVGSKIPAPRYGQRDLERLMPGFTVRQTRLLESGVQEYLFTKN